MRNLSLFAILTLLLLTLAPQSAPRGTAPQQLGGVGVIQGTVTKAGTSEGIADVQITLSLAGNRASLRQVQRTTTTDSSGQFELRDVPANTYYVEARHDGYFGLSNISPNMTAWTSASVSLTGGRTVRLALSMYQGGTINGRITKRTGEGIPKAKVTALRFVYRSGRAFLESVQSRQSDDHGNYRIFWLPPGEYFVSVIPPQQSVGQSGGTAAAPEIRTYFPDTIDPGTAQRVVVVDRDVVGINLIPQPSPAGVTVSGKIVATGPGESNVRNSVEAIYLVSLDSNVLTDISQTQVRNERGRSGEFLISNVLPGSYNMIALVHQADGQEYFYPRTRIEVGSSNIGDLVIPVRPGASLKGRITVHGSDPALDFDLNIQLRPNDGTPAAVSESPIANLKEAPGELSFTNVPDGSYAIEVTLPREDYVEDIRQGTRSIYDSGVTFDGKTPQEIDVIINTAGETIQGSVVDSDGKPVEEATVVLIPPLSRRQNFNLYKKAVSSRNGRFTMEGVAPGDYKLFAWQGTPDGAFENAAFMLRYEALGLAVVAAKGIRADPQVNVIRIDR